MRILLDTHVLLWAVGNSQRLPNSAREELEDPSNALFCSAASLWEIAIKAMLRGTACAWSLPSMTAGTSTSTRPASADPDAPLVASVRILACNDSGRCLAPDTLEQTIEP